MAPAKNHVGVEPSTQFIYYILYVCIQYMYSGVLSEVKEPGAEYTTVVAPSTFGLSWG